MTRPSAHTHRQPARTSGAGKAAASSAAARVRRIMAALGAGIRSLGRALRSLRGQVRLRVAHFAGMRRDIDSPQGVHEYYLKGLLFLVVSTIACFSMTFLLYSAFSGQLLGSEISYPTWDETLAQEGITAGAEAAGSASITPDAPASAQDTALAAPTTHQAGTRYGVLIPSALIGLVWGFWVILTIDRYLTVSMESLGRRLRDRAIRNTDANWIRRAGTSCSRLLTNLGQAVPRILLASVLGLVVSTPLTLQFFHQDIENEIKRRIETERAAVVQEFATSDEVKNATQAMADLRDNPTRRAQDAQDKAIAPLTERLAQAQEVVDTTYAKWDQANKDAIAEANYGSICGRGASWGPCAQALADQAANLKQELDIAQKNRDTIQQELAVLQARPVEADSSQEEKALADALRNQQILQDNLKGKFDRISANTGLLAQIEAEWSLGGAMKAAHLVLLLTFFFIEILPVLAQLLQNMRTEESHYERLCRVADDGTATVLEARHQAEVAEREVWWQDHLAAFKAGSQVQVKAAVHAASVQLANQQRANDMIGDRYWAHLEAAIADWDHQAAHKVGDALGPVPPIDPIDQAAPAAPIASATPADLATPIAAVTPEGAVS